MQHFINEFKDRTGNSSKVYFDDRDKQYVVKFYNHQGTHMDGSDFKSPSRVEAIKKAMPEGVEV